MSQRTTRGIASRLAATTPGGGRRALDAAIGVVATVRTIGALRRPNPAGEIELEQQTDGSFAPAGSVLETARRVLAEEQARARRQFGELSRRAGAVPDAIEDDDDDEIPDAR